MWSASGAAGLRVTSACMSRGDEAGRGCGRRRRRRGRLAGLVLVLTQRAGRSAFFGSVIEWAGSSQRRTVLAMSSEMKDRSRPWIQKPSAGVRGHERLPTPRALISSVPPADPAQPDVAATAARSRNSSGSRRAGKLEAGCNSSTHLVGAQAGVELGHRGPRARWGLLARRSIRRGDSLRRRQLAPGHLELNSLSARGWGGTGLVGPIRTSPNAWRVWEYSMVGRRRLWAAGRRCAAQPLRRSPWKLPTWISVLEALTRHAEHAAGERKDRT